MDVLQYNGDYYQRIQDANGRPVMSCGDRGCGELTRFQHSGDDAGAHLLRG